MPLPSPSGKQDKSGFISNCMSNDNMRKEFPDQKQRAAVCYSTIEIDFVDRIIKELDRFE